MDRGAPAGERIYEWQRRAMNLSRSQRGHDTDSIIADPGFVAPEPADFRLQANSPAL